LNSRAITPEQKREIIERIYAAWLNVPEQRLGQLLDNANWFAGDVGLFDQEDYALVVATELFAYGK
jgi:hypothetical protein